jgi:hypothetical protein
MILPHCFIRRVGYMPWPKKGGKGRRKIGSTKRNNRRKNKKNKKQ